MIIVNQAFVKQYFPNEEALGKQISPLADKPVPTEIVGILEDIKEGSLDSETRPTIYYPFSQNTDSDLCLVARTVGADAPVVAVMAAAVHKIDPDVMTIRGEKMTDQIHDSPSAYIHRSLAMLVGGFAALSLLLAVVGLHGVITYSVSQRTREIGVRMALGAERREIYGLVLKDAGGLIAIGVLLGIACAAGVGSLMKSVLFGVTSWDVPTLFSVALLLSLFASLASFIPARRAASVSPVEALRAE